MKSLYSIEKLKFEKVNSNTWWTHPADFEILKDNNQFIVYYDGFEITKVDKLTEAKQYCEKYHIERLLKFLKEEKCYS